jgi:hypothetical protein
VEAWFNGGPAVSAAIDLNAACVHTFDGKGGATWQIYPPNTARDNKKVAIAWNLFANPVALDDFTYGYKWTKDVVTAVDEKDGWLVTLPQFYRLEKDKGPERWVGVHSQDVPAETGLSKVEFPKRVAADRRPYVTPDEAESYWKKPGPAAGPFEAKLGDGSVVTYYWYRFADQPALLNADLTADEREAIQTRVQLLHKNWTKDREYLPPPKVGKLAELDPAYSSLRRRAWKLATYRLSRDRPRKSRSPGSVRRLWSLRQPPVRRVRSPPVPTCLEVRSPSIVIGS